MTIASYSFLVNTLMSHFLIINCLVCHFCLKQVISAIHFTDFFNFTTDNMSGNNNN